jgi:cell division protein FtsW (lipid II flippase)
MIPRKNLLASAIIAIVLIGWLVARGDDLGIVLLLFGAALFLIFLRRYRRQ